MKNLIFAIDPEIELDLAWQQLAHAGCEILYSIEEGGEQQLVGFLPSGTGAETLIECCPFVLGISEDPLEQIDWDAQWAEHGHGYKDGYLHIDLGDDRGVIRLIPGPGFGDLSHPTTRLMLRMMAKVVIGKRVVDIGCGSGVLSVAAMKLGATAVYGIDIDPEAVRHSKENGELNGMQEGIFFTESPASLIEALGGHPFVGLMNMIQTEQTVAWGSLVPIQGLATQMITSGILAEDERKYLDWCSEQGWVLDQREEEDGWVGYLFSIPQVEGANL